MSAPRWGGHSMVAPLRRVVVKPPAAAYTRLDQEWEPYGFRHRPDPDRAAHEHAALVALLDAAGAEVLTLPAADGVTIDSLYTHDASFICDAGVILLRTGKVNRRGEADALAASLAQWSVPVAGRVGGADEGPAGAAVAEGGDLVWLDERTVVAGRGFRTNAAGITQLAEILAPLDVQVVEVHLPFGQGAGHVLHLMSLISMLAEDLAVVHRPLLPVPLYELLVARGIEMVDVDPDEWDTQGGNVLALAPRDLVMVEGNPITQARLEAAGCTVRTFPGSQIAICGDGGPTCLTRPILRA